MKYLLILLFLVSCESNEPNRVNIATCFCKSHGGIYLLGKYYSTCMDNARINMEIVTEKEMCK